MISAFEVIAGVMLAFLVMCSVIWLLESDERTIKIKFFIIFIVILTALILAWPDDPIGYCEFVCPIESGEK